jgi:hypothetical protein
MNEIEIRFVIRNTNLKKNSGYEHPEDGKPELFK